MRSFYLAIATVILLFFSCKKPEPLERELKPIDQAENWTYQLQDADPQEVASTGFDLIVMDYSRDGSDEGRYSTDDLQLIKNSGTIPIAYISIGEAEDYRFYWQADWAQNPPVWLGSTNPDWQGNYAVQYWNAEWKQIIFSYLDKIIAQGFMGIYLDKVDEFEYWADSTNPDGQVWPEDSTALWMSQFIREIVDYVRGKAGEDFYVIPQNGERILEYDEDLKNVISAWGVEDMFYNGTDPWTGDDWYWIEHDRIPNLQKVLDAGHPVFSVDYVDNGTGYWGTNKERIDDYYQKCYQYGYIPYAARKDRALDKINIIEGLQP